MNIPGERQFRFAASLAIIVALWTLTGYFVIASPNAMMEGDGKHLPKRHAASPQKQYAISHDTVNAGAIARRLVASKVNINTADLDGLMKLLGVGRVLAMRIIKYRETHGRFRNMDELLNVKGIGRKKFSQFRHMIDIN